MYKYALTNTVLTLISPKGETTNIQRGAPNFEALRQAIINEDWVAVASNITVKKSLNNWAKGLFTFDDATSTFSYKGAALPNDINGRIVKMATAGDDPQPLLNFYERLQRNPSWRSVNQLYKFLTHEGIPIDADGRILAYKGLTLDYKDKHTRTIDNRPGTVHEMPRNQISDDPNVGCHVGFHVGSEKYATGFGERVVVCRVDPEHVVCVPNDVSYQKMRVCKYEVVGNHGATMPSTVIDSADVPSTVTQREEPIISDENVQADDDDKNITHFMSKSLDELRKIAAHDYKIVGASKLPGGKVALVEKILSVIASMSAATTPKAS